MKRNLFHLYIDKILNLPLIVRQVLYLKLTENEKETFLTYVPVLTFKGETELSEKKCGFDRNIYSFLQYCLEGQSLFDISINTFMSLEEVTKYCEFCIDQNYLNTPKSSQIKAMIGFISGKLRIGEYFNLIGTINNEQLQNLIQENNSQKHFGEILVEKGYTTSEELQTLLTIKEESQKRYILDHTEIPKFETCYDEKYKQEIKTLKDENIKLKKKMNQLLKLVGKNA